MLFPPSFRRVRAALAASIAMSLITVAGCAVGPDYKRPAAPVPTEFKEADALWRQARPAPRAAIDGRWWTVFGDETLAALCERALKANQTIAEYEAAYRAARAAVASSRSSLFPTISLSGSGKRSGTGAKAASSSSSVLSPGASSGQYLSNSVSAELDASWEPDLWGSVRRSIESADATAQASAAQLAAGQLSTTASLAVDYFTVRLADADLALLEQERAVDAELLALTEASYRQGVSSYDEVRTAHNTLRAIDESIASAQLTRRQYEHAIAVLVGEPPAAFSLPERKDFSFALPALPRAVPSELLERRPDVVQAERTVAEYNAKIGVAKAGYFPSLTLSASGGYDGTSLAHLVSLPTRVWSLGLSVAQTVFDAGATSASVRQAKANYDQQVAAYRQTVLGAFQDVEDYLAAVEIGARQAAAAQEVAERSAELAGSKRKALDAGTASRVDVLDTRLTEIEDRKTWLDYSGQALQSAVLLVKALGGAWNPEMAPALAQRE